MGGVGGGMGVGEGRSPTLLLLFVMVIVHDSTAYPQHPRQCLTQKNCNHGEYCEDQEKECRCKKNYVREPAGGCLAVRRENEPCILDKQCSSVDHRLLCHDGRCLNHTRPSPPPFFTSFNKTTLEPTRVLAPSTNVITPAIVCLFIFASFTILIFTMGYHFRNRSRRLAAPPNTGRVNFPSPAPSPRRNSVSTQGSLPILSHDDAPPSYNSLRPPSYEQATQQVTQQATQEASTSTTPDEPLNFRHTDSNAASMERMPFTLTSPDGSSGVSYGSGLTRTSLLSSSSADLTASTTLYQDSSDSPHHQRY
ncbi:uncharacterized protein LOC121872996 isoform X2 [Homarus americanus]|uniref:EB domain-containing protein n=1 Tax=Homarus americanus TaxID=6706 RepID=A0A8J5NBW6_HOMAM|nr:uncharacterized protein LOC121872996 isoform X2 [Homarus americanus]KAG7176591.1 hypothetical protein Hamer_G015394 [Homarus americanus]